MKFRYQVRVSAIKLIKGFAKFMIPYLSRFCVNNLLRVLNSAILLDALANLNELRDVDSIGRRVRNITI